VPLWQRANKFSPLHGAFPIGCYCHLMRIALALAVSLVASWGVAVADNAKPAAPKPVAKAREPGALVLVIDRSGSMQGPKLEAVKQAAKSVISAMHPDDTIAIVGFDSEATVFVQPTKSSNRLQINKDIDKLTSGGGTNIFPGLKEAAGMLKPLKVVKKHVILLSDGEAPNQGIAELVKEMRKDSVTISTVAVEGADDKMLESISKDGGGRFLKVTDIKTLSQVYVKEVGEAKLAAK
jgi:Mg-chelatase subunit ChlD